MTPSNKLIKTVVIKPGETFVLPSDATVTTVIGSVSSSGCTLPTPTSYISHVFYYDVPQTVSGTTTPSWVGVKYGTNKYFFNESANEGDPANVNTKLINGLKDFAELNPIIKNVQNGPFGPDLNYAVWRYSIQFDIAEIYLNDFFFIKREAVQGDVGQGADQTDVIYYVSIINE